MLLVSALVSGLATPAAAIEWSSPMMLLSSDVIGGAAVTLAENAGPPGAMAVAVYHVIDFTRATTDAALDREGESQQAQLVTMRAYDAQLKAWAAQGVDLNEDARAVKVKDTLHRLGIQMSAENLDSAEFMMRAVQRNLGYAVVRAGGAKLAELGLERLAKPLLSRIAPSLDGAEHWVDGRSGSIFRRKVLRAVGWSRLSERAAVAKVLPEQYMDKLLTVAADRLVDTYFKQAKGDVFERVYDDLHGLSQDVWRAQVRQVVARAQPVLLPAVMVAPPPLMAARAVAVPAQMVAADPVVATISAESRYIRPVRDRPDPPAHAAPEAPTPTWTPSEPAWRPSPEWQHHWDCAGSGTKAGCGGGSSFDGNNKDIYH